MTTVESVAYVPAREPGELSKATKLVCLGICLGVVLGFWAGVINVVIWALHAMH